MRSGASFHVSGPARACLLALFTGPQGLSDLQPVRQVHGEAQIQWHRAQECGGPAWRCERDGALTAEERFSSIDLSILMLFSPP
eukprot:2551877-Pleurochrysis_carterae.AAC.1